MISKIWRVIKFISVNWYIIKPILNEGIKYSKKLYEKVFKKPKENKTKIKNK